MVVGLNINYLPNNKILDQSKLKGFADVKTHETQKLEFILGLFFSLILVLRTCSKSMEYFGTVCLVL